MIRQSLCALGLALIGTPGLAAPEIPAALRDLQEPRIVERPAERVLVVEAKGDPKLVGPRAFGLLFQLYYRIPETPKGPAQPAPRARWTIGDRPRDEWIGHYAMPVPEAVRSIPEHEDQPGLKVALSTWDYGMTAEILHVGPYDQEAPTIQRLREAASAQGYVLAAGHEEEYVRGPTMAGPGEPENYLTILRYRVSPSGDGP